MSITFDADGVPRITPRSVAPKENPLDLELGWTDVADGLGRILISYLMVFGSGALVAAVLVWAILKMGPGGSVPRNSQLAVTWGVMAGIGLGGLMILGSYGMLLAGSVKCALHAPDRQGARWFMFACLVCMGIGPVMNIAQGIAGPPPEEAKRYQRMKFEQVVAEEMKKPPSAMNIIAYVISLASTVLSVLFLRAVGACFEHKALTGMAELYLLCFGLITAATLYLGFGGPEAYSVALIGTVVVGWAGLFLWYLVMLLFARTVILDGLRNRPSPLAAR